MKGLRPFKLPVMNGDRDDEEVEMNWFERHLNWATVLVWIIAAIIGRMIGLIQNPAVYFIGIRTRP